MTINKSFHSASHLPQFSSLRTTDRVSLGLHALGPSRVQYFTAGFTFHNALHIAVIISGHVTLTHIWLIALEVWKLLLRS